MQKCKICGKTEYEIDTKNFQKIFVHIHVMRGG